MNRSAYSGELAFSPSAERNQQPILAALREHLPPQGLILELGSGTGQHAVAFARELPDIDWQPTDVSAHLPQLAARFAAEGSNNIRPPVALDVLRDPWPSGPFAGAFSANTAHIMPWDAVLNMLAGLGRVLATGAPFLLYGPFKRADEFTSASNAQFDAALRSQDPAMGIRGREALESAAAGHHLLLIDELAMPANNEILLFRRAPSP